MKLRSDGAKKKVAVAMAAGVAAAEGVSLVYYMFAPWFLSPGPRSLYVSAAFNVILVMMLNRIAEKYWFLRTIQDAAWLAVWLAVLCTCVQAPHVISWYNPLTYTYVLGPFAHTFGQIAAMTLTLWYFKNKLGAM